MEDNRKTYKFHFDDEKVKILQSNGIYINRFFEMMNDDKIFNVILKLVPENYNYRRPSWFRTKKEDND